jgi:hypothetical protein
MVQTILNVLGCLVLTAFAIPVIVAEWRWLFDSFKEE